LLEANRVGCRGDTPECVGLACAGACENGLETVDKNVMTLHHEMKIFEADMKGETMLLNLAWSDIRGQSMCCSIIAEGGMTLWLPWA
jgi:hypothetical protein